MSKGKIRLIHVGTGARLLVQTPKKASIRSIVAFESDENGGTFLLAALVERSKDAQDEGVVLWQVPSAFVLQGKEDSEPTLLARVTADPYKSTFVYRFTAIAWNPTQPKLAISTSDSNVVVFDVGRQLLASSKSFRSFDESEVDPQSKDVARNEPLAGFAFSPDGTMLATISAPLEGDVSWILGFKSLDGKASAVDDMSFLIKSPLQEPMIISHLSFIAGSNTDGAENDDASQATAIRGVLIGFRCNTILGLYDLASRSFKHVWKFQSPPQASAGVEEHFNLVHLDKQSNTLLVCNSFRSSIFAVPLDLQPLPSLSGGTKLADRASLPTRLEQGLLPWSIQLSYPIEEYALQDPCTSVTISSNVDDADEPARLFVAFPEGISVVQLLKPECPAEESENNLAAPADEKPEAEPVPVAAAPEEPSQASAIDAQPALSKSSKKKSKKKKAAAAAASAEEAVPSRPEESFDISQAPSAEPPIVAASDEEPSEQHPSASTPRGSASVKEAPAQQPPAEISFSADDVNAALSDTITSAVHDAVSANISNGFQQSIETAIPQEVERLITSTELKAELTRNIAQTILPAVQRTAMEVVSRVLAPHFEEVMMQVSDRVERTIVSEITNVRKTLIAEQATSLNDTDKVVKAIQEQVNDVLVRVKDLKVQQTDKIVELKTEEAPRETTKLNGASRLVSTSADELSEVEAAPAVKARDFSETAPAPTTPPQQNARNTSLEGMQLAPAALPTKCRLPERVAIIGAGPVGCLAGLAFAQRGCKVDIFESRPDPRTDEAVARASQRSINLALSTRGITGLRSVSLVGLGKYASSGKDLADLVLQDSVPMRARMIHVVTKQATNGRDAQVKEISQLYSTKGESINSVDRGRLNNILLDHALMHPNVDVHFEHKLQTVDFDHDTRSAGQQASVPVANGVTVKKSIRGANGNRPGGESSADESYRRGGKGKALSSKNRRNGQQQQQAKSSAADRLRLEFNVHSNNQRIPKTTSTHLASFVVGCDGAHSSIRSAMGSLIRMHYTHNYIDTGYVELSIPARTSLSSGSRIRGSGGSDGKPGGHDAFHLDPNHLHIWPRHSFMLIALPNLDGSFTCTLFAPFKMFASELSNKDGILSVFREHFPDALPLIGEEKLVESLTSRRASALGSVQCDPYHYKDRAVLIGDAAHAMLPFYGQGLNCGFEDVRVMFDIIDDSEVLQDALERYTKERHPDLVAILQLAEQNYREMAHSVVSWPYLLRKKLDGLLMSVLPASVWSSLYAMTTFSNLPYSTVIKAEQRQQRVISNVLLTSVVGVLTGAVVGAYRTRGVWQPVTKGWIEGLQKKVA
uniref:Kynurenine 3-monooxygenase n=2 Tax=Kalmanozyma brasiliensis (strain GHG001) TaxID=1365824 RepID=V5GM97_KALBG